MKRTLIAYLVAAALSAFAPSAHADVITSPQVGGNGAAGNMFDIVVTPSIGITVQEITVNYFVSGTATIEVYSKSGTHVGSETTSGDWTLVSTNAGITSTGPGDFATVDVTDFVLNGGTSALYITTTGGALLSYHNGTGVGNSVVSDGNVELLEGVGKAYPFSTTFTPRVWEGSITYVVNPEPGTFALFGLGVAGLVGLAVRRRRKRTTDTVT